MIKHLKIFHQESTFSFRREKHNGNYFWASEFLSSMLQAWSSSLKE